MEKTECGVRSRSTESEYGVRSTECGVRSTEYGIRSTEYAVRSTESVKKLFIFP